MQACGGKDSEHRPSADRPGGRDRGPRGLERTWTPTDRCRCTPACAGATSHAPAPCSPWRCSSSPGRTCARPSPSSHPPARSRWSRPRRHHPSHPRRPSHPPSLRQPRPQPSRPSARAPPRSRPSARAPPRSRPSARARAQGTRQSSHAAPAHERPRPSGPPGANAAVPHADPHPRHPTLRSPGRRRHHTNAIGEPRFPAHPKPFPAEPPPSSHPSSADAAEGGGGREEITRRAGAAPSPFRLSRRPGSAPFPLPPGPANYRSAIAAFFALMSASCSSIQSPGSRAVTASFSPRQRRSRSSSLIVRAR